MNKLGARYLVVGGFAIIEAGLPRLTADIDLSGLRRWLIRLLGGKTE